MFAKHCNEKRNASPHSAPIARKPRASFMLVKVWQSTLARPALIPVPPDFSKRRASASAFSSFSAAGDISRPSLIRSDFFAPSRTRNCRPKAKSRRKRGAFIAAASASSSRTSPIRNAAAGSRTTWKPAPAPVDQQRILDFLIRAELFEQVLHQRYLGSKRFSLEGSTALIPLSRRNPRCSRRPMAQSNLSWA